MRRTVSTQTHLLDYQGNPPWVEDAANAGPSPLDYVSHLVDGSPFERLLWLEIKLMERSTHMTDWQRAAFESYLRGESIREAAALYHRTPSTIHQHLHAALAKAETFPHRGLLTCTIEALGWPTMRNVLAGRLEARLSRRYRTAA